MKARLIKPAIFSCDGQKEPKGVGDLFVGFVYEVSSIDHYKTQLSDLCAHGESGDIYSVDCHCFEPVDEEAKQAWADPHMKLTPEDITEDEDEDEDEVRRFYRVKELPSAAPDGSRIGIMKEHADKIFVLGRILEDVDILDDIVTIEVEGAEYWVPKAYLEEVTDTEAVAECVDAGDSRMITKGFLYNLKEYDETYVTAVLPDRPESDDANFYKWRFAACNDAAKALLQS